MASIFDLKTSTSELSSANQGTSRIDYEQHPPTRAVDGANFPNGAIHHRWQTAGQKWWIPSRSYMRMRCRLTKADGSTPLDLADEIAPNYGLMSNLFQSAEFRINDKTVSRVSDFMPQVDALETRLSKSRSWIKSVGIATNWWGDDYQERKAEVSSDGQTLQNPTVIQPVETGRVALGFDAAGGAGNDRNAATYTAATGRIVFTQNGGAALPADVRPLFPVGSYFTYKSVQGGADGVVNVLMEVIAGIGVAEIEVRAVVGGNVPQDGRTDWARVEGPVQGAETRRLDGFELIWQPPLSIFKIGHALPSGKYELVLNPQTAQSYQKRAIESLVDKAGGGGDFVFQVIDMYLYTSTVDGPRADDITYLLDLEETRCQTDTVQNLGAFQQRNFDVSPSTFALTCAFQDARAGNLTQYSASKFQLNSPGGVGGDELKLNRLFLNYAGQNKPSPDADPRYKVGNASDYTIQRYAETQIYSGAYYDTGGAETIQEYHGAGSYYYFSWSRDGTDRSTRVNVHFGFEGGAIDNARVLLFDHSKKIARIRVQDGRVVDVQTEDA
jgi:hypothetical protein